MFICEFWKLRIFERIVAYAVQNGRNPKCDHRRNESFHCNIAVKVPANPELSMTDMTVGGTANWSQYMWMKLFTSVSYSVSLVIKNRSSGRWKQAVIFLRQQILTKTHWRHTVPTTKDWNLIQGLNEVKIQYTYSLLAHRWVPRSPRDARGKAGNRNQLECYCSHFAVVVLGV